MDLIIYRFWDRKWAESHHLTQKDVALLVDKSNKLIYIYEGLYATPQKQIDAKTMLGSIKVQYTEYKFRMIGTNTPNEITQKLEDALKDTQEIQTQLKQNQKQLEFTIRCCGIIALSLLILLLVQVLIRFFDPMLWYLIRNKIESPPGTGVIIDDHTNPSQWFQIASFITLITIIILTLMSVISGVFHRYQRMGFSITSIVLLLILVEFVWYRELNELLSHSISTPVYFSTFLWSIILVIIAIVNVIFGIIRQRISLEFELKNKGNMNKNSVTSDTNKDNNNDLNKLPTPELTQ